MTLSEWIRKNKVGFEAERIPERPDQMGPSDWDRAASHWKTTLKCGRRRMTVYFSQGSAHTKPPTLEDVLGCIIQDVRGLSDQSFRDWCQDYGYDEDSRKAEWIYKELVKQDSAIRRVFGGPLYIEIVRSDSKLEVDV